MDKQLETLYSGVLADGALTKKEVTILLDKAVETGEDLHTFKRKLMDEYIARLLQNKSEINKKEVRQICKYLDLNADEYDILLDQRVNQELQKDIQQGKRFIDDLQRSIKYKVVYNHQGKYGKEQVDRTNTDKAKYELLFLANPQTPCEIYEYVVFLNSLKYIHYYGWEEKLNSIVTEGEKNYPSNQMLKNARIIMNKNKRHWHFRRALCIILTIIFVLAGLSVFWIIEDFNKVLYGWVFVLIILPLSFIPYWKRPTKRMREKILKDY